MVAGRDALTGALIALMAIPKPFRKRVADAALCLLCAETARSPGELPPDLAQWLAGVRTELKLTGGARPLSDTVRRWAEALERSEAQRIANMLVVAHAEKAREAGGTRP